MKPTFLSTASEQTRVAQLFAHVRDAVILIDPDGQVGFWSQGAADIYGREAPEALNRSYMDLIPQRCRAPQIRQIQRALEGEESGAEWQTIDPDGKLMWLEGSFRPVNDGEGRLLGCGILIHNVTKWRTAEMAKQAADDLLRSITDNIPGAVFQFQVWPNGRRALPFVSRGVGTLLERSPAEMSAALATGEILVVPEDREGFWSSQEKSRKTLSPWEAEFRVRTARSSQLKWIRLRATPTRLLDGGTLWNGVLTDVSDRASAVLALEESEDRYRRLFEDSRIGIYRTTPDGRFLLANPAAVRMLGCCSFEELETRNLESESPIAGYDRQAFKSRLELDGEVRGLEAAWPREDGEVLHVRENARAIRAADGSIAYYEGTLEDITDRRRAEIALREREELLQNVLTHIPGGVFWKDRNCVYLGCNDLIARNSGLESPDKIVGLNDHDLGFDAVEAEFFRNCDRRVMETGTPILNLEETQTRSGAKYVLLTSKVPLRDESGEVVGVLGMYQDITDRKRLEEQLRRAHKLEAVGRLAGGVAHDFNNLLTVINGFSEMVIRGLSKPDPVRIGSQMEEIRKAGERASTLTRQLLAFGRQQIQMRTRVNLNEVVEETRKLIARVIGEDIEIGTALCPDLAAIHADVGQLEQVIMNLALNARDAMPDGGLLILETGNARIDVAPDEDVRPGAYVTLAVTDTGLGMDEETRARAFEPFFTTKELGKGTGLGLATVYGIVKQSGGHIEVESEVDRGTTFRIYLPRHDSVVEASVRVPTASAIAGQETVLLVEDDDGVRKVTATMLRSLGYRVVEAAGGIEAIRHCREHHGPIHLLITDVVMPLMNGREVADRVQELIPRVRTLFMSGYTDDSILRHGVLDEGVAFLSKPLSHDTLGRKVREVLAGAMKGSVG
jgi:PAS domain S-box-containing protein